MSTWKEVVLPDSDTGRLHYNMAEGETVTGFSDSDGNSLNFIAAQGGLYPEDNSEGEIVRSSLLAGLYINNQTIIQAVRGEDVPATNQGLGAGLLCTYYAAGNTNGATSVLVGNKNGYGDQLVNIEPLNSEYWVLQEGAAPTIADEVTWTVGGTAVWNTSNTTLALSASDAVGAEPAGAFTHTDGFTTANTSTDEYWFYAGLHTLNNDGGIDTAGRIIDLSSFDFSQGSNIEVSANSIHDTSDGKYSTLWSFTASDSELKMITEDNINNIEFSGDIPPVLEIHNVNVISTDTLESSYVDSNGEVLTFEALATDSNAQSFGDLKIFIANDFNNAEEFKYQELDSSHSTGVNTWYLRGRYMVQAGGIPDKIVFQIVDENGLTLHSDDVPFDSDYEGSVGIMQAMVTSLFSGEPAKIGKNAQANGNFSNVALDLQFSGAGISYSSAAGNYGMKMIVDIPDVGNAHYQGKSSKKTRTIQSTILNNENSSDELARYVHSEVEPANDLAADGTFWFHQGADSKPKLFISVPS